MGGSVKLPGPRCKLHATAGPASLGPPCGSSHAGAVTALRLGAVSRLAGTLDAGLDRFADSTR